MWYNFLADVIVAIHVAYVSFVVVGLVLILVGIPLGWQWTRNVWLRLTHLVMILIVVAEEFLGIECPLTTWERNLAVASGRPGDERSFVGRLLDNLIFIDVPDNNWIWPVIYVGFAGLVLLAFVAAPPHWKRKAVQ
jgi:hypothetical protein